MGKGGGSCRGGVRVTGRLWLLLLLDLQVVAMRRLPSGHIIHKVLLIKGWMMRVVLVLRWVHLVVRCHGNCPRWVVLDVLWRWNGGVDELWLLLVVELRMLWINLGS